LDFFFFLDKGGDDDPPVSGAVTFERVAVAGWKWDHCVGCVVAVILRGDFLIIGGEGSFLRVFYLFFFFFFFFF
jgi:hypothetical protein